VKILKTLVLGGCLALLDMTGVAEARPMCPMIYRPVCAVTRAGHWKTFPNDCMAHNARARIRHGGECRHR
jgi:hypothetical protein